MKVHDTVGSTQTDDETDERYSRFPIFMLFLDAYGMNFACSLSGFGFPSIKEYGSLTKIRYYGGGDALVCRDWGRLTFAHCFFLIKH